MSFILKLLLEPSDVVQDYQSLINDNVIHAPWLSRCSRSSRPTSLKQYDHATTRGGRNGTRDVCHCEYLKLES